MSMCSNDQSPKHIWVIKVVAKNNFQVYLMVRLRRKLKSLSRFSLYFLHLSSSLEIRIKIRILYVKGLVLRLPHNLL